MDSSHAPAQSGPFESRYLAFLETIVHLRLSLHRYCSRMTGLVLDGEDVVQDALFQAYRKLDTFDDARPLAPWLFRIAHNRCIDFLRRRNPRSTRENRMANVIAINPFEVPAGKGKDALALWERFAAYFRRQPGYVSTKPHRATHSDARFYLVSISEWESAAHFQAALGGPEVQSILASSAEHFPNYPAIYEVIRT